MIAASHARRRTVSGEMGVPSNSSQMPLAASTPVRVWKSINTDSDTTAGRGFAAVTRLDVIGAFAAASASATSAAIAGPSGSGTNSGSGVSVPDRTRRAISLTASARRYFNVR
ncbi:MAG TPA: hypothetical protein VM282_24830, partial [Acidimicrobiales bacterium]|nr:hypothetical protein [Acidimicrobiales bacterium]